MRAYGILVTGFVLLAIGIGGLALLATGLLPLDQALPRGDGSASRSVARGEWIFRTATDVNGQPIPYSGGMMMPMSCAGCHGPDGHGIDTPMFEAPNITYRNLTDPAGMREPDGTRGPRYTDALIRRAVTQGIDASGKPLDWPMPRWHLSSREWEDLLTYLKTLR
jgi:mono/diheme cytochrome c family protein